MESNQKLKDLQWVLQAIKTETLNLHSISFYLSHPTSGCFEETENSMNVTISEDNIGFLSAILIELATAQEIQPCLRNLEFHNVEWELELIQSLGILLDNNSNIKRVSFRRNGFDSDCLSELSDILKTNNVIKEFMFMESGIGSVGASAIASALKVNECLEELQIWDDSIGSKGSEELSKMIEANSTLKLLTIFDSSCIAATPLISAVLARNRDMEVHVWNEETAGKKNSSKVVEFVPENNTLRVYRLDVSGTCRLACALGLNTTVKSLDLTGVRLKSRWAKEFRWVLEQNRSLKDVTLSKTCLKDKAVVYIAAGLFKNKGLESLYLDGNCFSGIGVEHLLCPLSRFSTLQYQANTTLRSVTFGGRKTKISREGLRAICKMVTTNETVTHLGIHDDESLRPEDFVQVFRSLQKNASLKSLSLQGCRGVRGDRVLQTVMETLEVNPWIENIDLVRTPLQVSGKADGVCQRLGQNGGTKEVETDLVKDMSLTEPKSCRVFFCGQEYAGKTTLCNSISNNFASSSKIPYMDTIRTIVNPVEQAVKTVGMKIKTFKDIEDTKISIWNLAGQHEFYALHDLMFPGHGSASFFLIVSSLFRKPNNKEQKTPSEVEEDLHYWLKFIVSNSKRAIQQYMLPNVTIVLTHSDKVDPSSTQTMLNTVQRLRDKFRGFVEFYPTVFTVDARSTASVNKLTQHIRKTSKTILQRVPRVYQLCNDLIHVLSEWRAENHNKPAIKWKEFGEICQVKVPSLRIRTRRDDKENVEKRRRAVATCLHHIGEVIYFDDLGYMILDCEWFCGEVLAQLVKLDVRKRSSTEDNGFIKRNDLEKILKENLQSPIPGMSSKVVESLDVGDLIRMMMKLELCYDRDPSDSNSLLLIPSILEEGRGKPQKWKMNAPDSCIFAGRHLECDDSSRMFLTPGFFPRLQVHLHNKVMALKNQHGATYTLEKYLISITINGIHIRVELGGQLGYYIDILACSNKTLTETLRLIHQLIVPSIQSLCHGVTLTENIIRPECVQNLTPPRYRKTQFVSLQQLKQALLSVPAENMYDYQHTWDHVSDSGKPILKPGFDLARDLLSDDDFREVLHRRYHDLYNLSQELQFSEENNHIEAAPTPPDQLIHAGDDVVDPTFGGIAKGVETVLQRLKIIEQEIRDLKQEIQGLRYHEHRLLQHLHQKVNYLVNYNVQIDERKVPNMFYFVETENYSRKLITTIVSGMNALRLHMLCEYRREMHVVEDQNGCEVMQIDNVAVKSLAPYTTKFMKMLTFALKIGAHLAAGMGELIPDLSKEVAHLADSSVMVGAAAAGIVGATGLRRSKGRESARDIRQDQRAAQQWVVDFLRDRRCATGRDIAEKFGLWRVRYRDDGYIAWICKRHMVTRVHEIIEVPV